MVPQFTRSGGRQTETAQTDTPFPSIPSGAQPPPPPSAPKIPRRFSLHNPAAYFPLLRRGSHTPTPTITPYPSDAGDSDRHSQLKASSELLRAHSPSPPLSTNSNSSNSNSAGGSPRMREPSPPTSRASWSSAHSGWRTSPPATWRRASMQSGTLSGRETPSPPTRPRPLPRTPSAGSINRVPPPRSSWYASTKRDSRRLPPTPGEEDPCTCGICVRAASRASNTSAEVEGYRLSISSDGMR